MRFDHEFTVPARIPVQGGGISYVSDGQASSKQGIPLEDIFDKSALLERVGRDEVLLGELVSLFLDDCPRLIKDLRDAVLEKNAARLKMTAHALKGSVSNFAASAAHEAALRLESMGQSGDLTDAEKAFAALEAELDRLKPALADMIPEASSTREW